ncbi:hypothetical protein [Lactococcus lactis]|uniref:hypothetical protein n=1 Tax=Lactococcus lactis TaxID=1358 RepID=UPI003C705E27
MDAGGLTLNIWLERNGIAKQPMLFKPDSINQFGQPRSLSLADKAPSIGQHCVGKATKTTACIPKLKHRTVSI